LNAEGVNRNLNAEGVNQFQPGVRAGENPGTKRFPFSTLKALAKSAFELANACSVNFLFAA
jgi:hypothetical protein